MEFLEKYFTEKNTKLLAIVGSIIGIFLFVIKIIIGILSVIVIGIFNALPFFNWRFLEGLSSGFSFIQGVVSVAAGLVAICAIVALVFRMLVHDEKGVPVYMAIGAAAISLLGICVGSIGFICFLIAFIIGLDLVARVYLRDQDLTGNFDFNEDVETYKTFIHNFRVEKDPAYADSLNAKYSSPEIKQMEDTPEVEPGESFFDGRGLEYFGYYLLAVLVSSVTCTLGLPWMLVMITKWRISHTTIDGRRQYFNGTGGQLFGLWIKWLLLSLITCGIYAYFAYVDYVKWETKHTCYDDEKVAPNQPMANQPYVNSFFDGNTFEYVGYNFICGLLVSVTCGLATPWTTAILERWAMKHTVIGGKRYFFDGTGGQVLGQFLLIVLFSAITCGIYFPWGVVRWNKWIVKHTHVDARWVDNPNPAVQATKSY